MSLCNKSYNSKAVMCTIQYTQQLMRFSPVTLMFSFYDSFLQIKSIKYSVL